MPLSNCFPLTKQSLAQETECVKSESSLMLHLHKLTCECMFVILLFI